MCERPVNRALEDLRTSKTPVKLGRKKRGASTSQHVSFGLEVKTRVAQNFPTPHLSPTDLQGAAVDYTAEALSKLTDLGVTKGLGLALSPHD